MVSESPFLAEISPAEIKKDIKFLSDSANRKYFPSVQEFLNIRNMFPYITALESILGGLMLTGLGPTNAYARVAAIVGQAVAFNAAAAKMALNSIIAYVKTKKVLMYHKERSQTEAVDTGQVVRLLKRMSTKSQGPASYAGMTAAIEFCYAKESSEIIEKLFPRRRLFATPEQPKD